MNLVNLVTMGEGDSSTSTTTGDALPWSAAGPVVLTLELCFFRTLAILPSFFPSLFSFRYPICSSHFLRGSRMPLWNIYDFLGKLIGIIFHTLILSSCLRRERESSKTMIFLPLLLLLLVLRLSMRSMAGGPFGDLRRWQTFVTFDEFSWEFFLHSLSKNAKHSFRGLLLARRTNTG